MTTNSTAPHCATVPDLSDAERLMIVQKQIRALLVQAYTLEAAVTATPKDAQQHKELVAELAYTRATLAGYRAIETELIGRLNSTIASATP